MVPKYYIPQGKYYKIIMIEEEKNILDSQKNPIKIIPSILVVLFFSIVVYLSFFSFNENGINNISKQEILPNKILILKLEQVPLEATAVFVWDVYNQREIFSKNSETQLPLASLSKVMTALVASDYDDKNIIVKIDKENLKHDGNNGLIDNERWNLKNLLDFTLISSSNDGASAVATAVQSISKKESENEIMSFAEKMNKKAKELNLKQTYFLNESGLDIDENYLSGSYGSARDITMLFDHIIKNKPWILEATSYKNLSLKSEDKVHNTENTNEIIDNIPWIIASKTGYTDLAGGNLVVAFDNGMMRPVIVSILGSSKEGRFEDIKKIVDAVFTYKNIEE